MIAPIDGDWAYPNEQPDEWSRSYATHDDLLAALARERLHNPWWTT